MEFSFNNYLSNAARKAQNAVVVVLVRVVITCAFAPGIFEQLSNGTEAIVRLEGSDSLEACAQRTHARMHPSDSYVPVIATRSHLNVPLEAFTGSDAEHHTVTKGLLNHVRYTVEVEIPRVIDIVDVLERSLVVDVHGDKNFPIGRIFE